MSLPVWRELKRKTVWPCLTLLNEVWMSLPVWREWKLTPGVCWGVLYKYRSEWAFPFEGNWNESEHFKVWKCVMNVWMSLPVWRELKLKIWRFSSTISDPVWMSLPVWRELKHNSEAKYSRVASFVWMSLPVWRELKHFWRGVIVRITTGGVSEWAFPFEGNGNATRLFQFCSNVMSLNEPSRLKEWKPCSAAVVGSDEWSEWAFPFEGNGNHICSWRQCTGWGWVWMSLPVWREWKLFYKDTRRCLRSYCLNEPSPFEGNWNTTSPFWKLPVSAVSEWAFPFEGNGNLRRLFPTMRRTLLRLNEPSRLKGMETS